MSWWKNCTEESVEPAEIKLGVEKAKAAYEQATNDFERLRRIETDGEILRFIAEQLIIVKQVLSSK